MFIDLRLRALLQHSEYFTLFVFMTIMTVLRYKSSKFDVLAEMTSCVSGIAESDAKRLQIVLDKKKSQTNKSMPLKLFFS